MEKKHLIAGGARNFSHAEPNNFERGHKQVVFFFSKFLEEPITKYTYNF